MNLDSSATAVLPFTERDLSENLQVVFSPLNDLDNALHREQIYTSFANLAGMFVATQYPSLNNELVFDVIGIQAAFRRFHRDAFGVGKLYSRCENMISDNKLSQEAFQEIQVLLPSVGIRINTPSPRKTKIAAAFALWMSVFRPVHLRGIAYPGLSRTSSETFFAQLCFWICVNYLQGFGTITLLEDAEYLKRIARIRHDLTYRSLNLSSLELLFASIFRLRNNG